MVENIILAVSCSFLTCVTLCDQCQYMILSFNYQFFKSFADFIICVGMWRVYVGDDLKSCMCGGLHETKTWCSTSFLLLELICLSSKYVSPHNNRKILSISFPSYPAISGHPFFIIQISKFQLLIYMKFRFR